MQDVDDNEEDDDSPYASVAPGRASKAQNQRGPSRRLSMRDARIAKSISK